MKRSSLSLCHFRFFDESLDSSETPTLESCVIDFFPNAYDSMAIFVDTAASKCWFGKPSTSTGAITLNGSSWTVYVKESMLYTN